MTTQIDDTELETSDSLRQEIVDLQAKLSKLEDEQDEPVEMVTQPLADVLLKIEKGTEIWRYGITPAEVMLLVAEHHLGAGEMPIKQIVLRADKVAQLQNTAKTSDDPKERAQAEGQLTDPKKTQTSIEVDPRELKGYLIGRSTGEKVEKLFPGSEPKFPKGFKRAMQLGLGAKLPDSGLFSMDLAATS